MLRIIIGYASFEDNVQFLAVKQDYIHDPLWKTAFYIHVFSALLALLAGFSQFSKTFFKRYRNWHRRMGKIYVWNILAVNVPAGMILALTANGGWAGRAAFILLDVLWAYFTYQALASARKKDFSSHRDYMIRSYALTLSALSLRAWHSILVGCGFSDGVELYIMEAWLGFVPNLLIAESVIRYYNYRRNSGPMK